MSRPERTCVGCRAATDPAEMVRLVADPDGVVVVDLKGNLPGRGAWVHAQRECLDASLRQLPRALKGPVQVAHVPDAVREAVVRALSQGLSQAAAGGALVGGRTAVEEALASGRALELVLAADAAERTTRAVRASVPEGVDLPPTTVVPLTADEVGRLTGKGALAVLAVTSAPAGTHLRRQLRRLRSLG